MFGMQLVFIVMGGYQANVQRDQQGTLRPRRVGRRIRQPLGGQQLQVPGRDACLR